MNSLAPSSVLLRFASFCLFISVFFLSACASETYRRGPLLDEDVVKSIHADQDDVNDVIEKLGSPTVKSTFSDINETWYYVSKEVEKKTLLPEKTISQNVVAVEFDPWTKKVIRIRRYSLDDAQKIDPETDYTKTRGNETSDIVYFFRNIGRFTPPTE